MVIVGDTDRNATLAAVCNRVRELLVVHARQLISLWCEDGWPLQERLRLMSALGGLPFGVARERRCVTETWKWLSFF